MCVCVCVCIQTDVFIAMELMGTCAEKLKKRIQGPIPEKILGKMTVAVRGRNASNEDAVKTCGAFLYFFVLLCVCVCIPDSEGVAVPQGETWRHPPGRQTIQHPPGR